MTDDELRALAPKLSQEIDLTRFVPLADIDPMHFEHGYFLVPGKRSGKAYRLLARVMEERGRAGIATFVMRGKQYLIAITASGGLLRAETLRFSDELRSADELAIGENAAADSKAVEAFERQINMLRADALAADDLEDTHTQGLMALIEKKRSKGTDVIAARDVRFEDSAGAQIVDLLQYLKRASVAESRSRPRSRSARVPPSARPSLRNRRSHAERGLPDCVLAPPGRWLVDSLATRRARASASRCRRTNQSTSARSNRANSASCIAT